MHSGRVRFKILSILLIVCTKIITAKNDDLVKVKQVTPEFECKSVGKFVDPVDPHRYHQCFYLFGQLTYIHNICPFQTCFDAELDYCTPEACNKATKPNEKDKELYICKGKTYKCKKKGVFAHPQDKSIYFKCSKVWGKWTEICYTCNHKHKTCFSNTYQACIPNRGKSCNEQNGTDVDTGESGGGSGGGLGGGEGGDGNSNGESGEEPGTGDNKPVTVTYDCEGYTWFPCYKLGIGLHQFPGDKSVYMQCTKNGQGKMQGKCYTCPKKGNTCFVDGIDQCIERCGKGSPHQPYNCSTYTVEDVECENEGLMAHSTETSVFFNCVKDGTQWDFQCFTCSNGKTKTCFSELQQACVTYSGAAVEVSGKKHDHRCPPITIIDGPQDANEVGTADSSLTWDCSGYNEQSFPCDKFELGLDYATPADRSVHFTCSKQGDKFIAECHACPSETWSCYDDEKETCVHDCVPRVHLPYDCRTYCGFSYPCTQTGFFANPNDTSIYHQCVVDHEGKYQAYCYACSAGDKKTCFSNEEQACVTNGPPGDHRLCGTIESLEENPDKGTKEGSLTYSKEGYSDTSFPCDKLESGEYPMYGDVSMYVTCHEGGQTEFHVCPSETKSCYDPETKACVENCGQGPKTTTVRPVPSYSCQDISFDCVEEGLFVYPLDTSLYIKCVTQLDNKFQALCYTCNSYDQTCFSEEKQSCVKYDTPCGDKSTLPEGDKDRPPHRGYTCEGYTETSFPCDDLGVGSFGVPGDLSVFTECYTTSSGQVVGKCHTCQKSSSECYNDDMKVCVKNCGEGEILVPYDCSTYDDSSYPCTKEGYFANSFQTSIYFQCVKVEGVWKSYCYTCNSETKTCYNEQKQACVLNGGKPCGNTTMPETGGDKHESLSYTCDGYNKTSFPCAKLGPGTYVMPGDHSVYWTCTEDGDAECQACDKEKRECWDPESQKCVENYGRGPPPKPYNCSGYHKSSFKCKSEGYFVNPKDSSIYFRCRKDKSVEGGWVADCFTCNSRNQTCFDDLAKTCVDNGGRPCGGKVIEVVGSSVDGGKPVLVPRNASRIFSCVGYEGYQMECKKPGNFTVAGDQSIYYSCIPTEGRLLAHCKACSKASKGCFFEDKNQCVDNCGKGTLVTGTIRAYDCSGYTLGSFPCQKEGLFANPQDPTVFFHCVKGKANKWESRCYSCNALSKSCFNNQQQRCIIGCVDELNSATTRNPFEITPSVTYGDNCRGYSVFSIPCAALMAHQSGSMIGVKNYFAHFGDPAVFFHCVQVGLFWQAFCHMCPLSSCFDQAKQDCTYPCDDYIPTEPENPLVTGPPQPYDCRFYTDDSYPCVEEGVFGNPIDTSTYFLCTKVGGEYLAVCYTCNSKVKTCYIEAKKSCFMSEREKCGGANTMTNATHPGKTYDCEGYPPKPSLPCSMMGVGSWPIPGDTSVFFTCDEQGVGKCHTCSQEKRGCYDEKKGKCVNHCTLFPYKPYSCAIYDQYSFHCMQEGYFAQLFDSSVFFQCVREGKYWKALCHTCNSHLKTCFSNKLQACLTKGGNPCGEGDPGDVVVGGTEEGSRHHTCQGYNELSYPCAYYKAGKFGTPADASIFFNCLKVGDKWLAECGACSKIDDSCFDGQQKICVENCGRGKTEPYRCHSYDLQAYACKREGYFSNPKDGGTTFFKCVKSTGVWSWKSHCFSCNSRTGTCFDEKTAACLTNDGVPCKQITGPEGNTGGGGGGGPTNPPRKGKPEESRSYDCSGYNELSLPCNLYGPGKWAMPADPSVYFECRVSGGQLVAECRHCDSTRHQCFSDKEQHCLDNCGLGPHKPWECLTRRYFRCVSEGLFAEPNDTSVFYKCQRKGDGTLEVQCFTCNNGHQKTCFSQSKQVCLKIEGNGPCGGVDPAEVYRKTEETSRTYDCTGYRPHQKSFPCDKYGPGVWPTPAERGVYFECKQSGEMECKACNPSTVSVFDPVQKKCVPNNGNGPDESYNCRTYTDISFNCKAPGFFANPKDSSVFFKCVKKGDGWDVWCHTCSKTAKTCFSNSQQACVNNRGKRCEGDDVFLKNPEAGSAELSYTWDCSGYSMEQLSYPCAKRSPGKYVHPGDRSVYFMCEKKDNRYVAVCKTCDVKTRACVDKETHNCVDNCARGKLKPYDCRTVGPKSYPCTEEGGYWAHPSHTSLFFRCAKYRGDLEALCYTCSMNKKTCFSNEMQACLTVSPEKKCTNQDPVDQTKYHGTIKSSLSYDANTFNKNTWKPRFPCHRKGEGRHYHPGDMSLYVECKRTVENGQEKWTETFYNCGDRERGGFFNKHTKQCEPDSKWEKVTGEKPGKPINPEDDRILVGGKWHTDTSRETESVGPIWTGKPTKKPQKAKKPQKQKKPKSFPTMG